jgi:competence protein ComEA
MEGFMKKLFVLLVLCSSPAFAEPVNINKADADTISKALNGIGAKKAEAIVKYRAEHGEFKTLKELENVNGIGEKTIQINEKDILLSDSPALAPEAGETKPNNEKDVGAVKKPSDKSK